MIGHDDKDTLIIHLSSHSSHQFIHPFIQVLDYFFTHFCLGSFERRVLRVQVTPEHVLDTVCGLEDTGNEPLFRLVHGVEEHLLPFFVIGIREF